MNDEKRALLNNLGYLYLAFAHLTDANLQESELLSIKSKIHSRSPEFTSDEVNDLLDDAITWYNKTADERLKVVNTIASAIHYEIEDVEIKTSILDDLVAIAQSDGNYQFEEKAFVNVLGQAWGIDYKA
jgi:lysyl-tRNA synthetase class I